MSEFKVHLYLFIIPGIIGNVAHMVVVKKDLFPALAKPISTNLFGRNKTFRGFVFLPLAIGTSCLLTSTILGPFSTSGLKYFLIGIGLGLAYIFAELPNSFLKRRVGIEPGESASKFRFLQLIMDKTDSLLGACLFYFFAMKIDIRGIVLLFIISFLLHLSISFLLVILKLKKSI